MVNLSPFNYFECMIVGMIQSIYRVDFRENMSELLSILQWNLHNPTQVGT